VAVAKAVRAGSASIRPLLLAPPVVKLSSLSIANTLIHAARDCFIGSSMETIGKTTEKLPYCAVGVIEAGVRALGSR
jgi:hypothetical protein